MLRLKSITIHKRAIHDTSAKGSTVWLIGPIAGWLAGRGPCRPAAHSGPWEGSTEEKSICIQYTEPFLFPSTRSSGSRCLKRKILLSAKRVPITKVLSCKGCSSGAATAASAAGCGLYCFSVSVFVSSNLTDLHMHASKQPPTRPHTRSLAIQPTKPTAYEPFVPKKY